MMMIPEERRAQILRKLDEKRYVLVSDLAEEFQVTTVTIRRDLDEIETDGFCVRKRGGAIRINRSMTTETPYAIKQHEMVTEKERIALAALEMIEDGDTLILDAGSTTYALALLLNRRNRITVVTNDLKIASKLSENPKIKLICTGGVARSSVYSLQGMLAESFIKDIQVDKAFLGADAIHPSGTISNVNIEEVTIKKAMMDAAEQKILLADSSKYNKQGSFKVCDLEDLDVLIMDNGMPQALRVLLDKKEVTALIV